MHMLAILKTCNQTSKVYDLYHEKELTKSRGIGWEGEERLGRGPGRREGSEGKL